MKKLLPLIAFLPLALNAFNLTINSGVEKGNPFSIITLSDEREFECVEQILAYDTKRYACMFDDDGMVKIDDVDLALMDIRYKKQDGKLFVVVLPKANSRLVNLEMPLHENSKIFKNDSRISKRFSIVIDPALKEFDKTAPNGLNFAPKFDDMLLPSVGALDFSKAPIEGMDSNDIDLYVNLKKSYESEFYDRVLDAATTAITRHPNSIFASEFLLYRIRAISKQLDMGASIEDIDYENVVSEGKAWMRKFPSDDNYAEVLYLVSRAYLKQSMNSDARYMMDILNSEHANSNYSKLATLDYADAIYKNSQVKEAIKLYEFVLYNTKDLDIASRAALALADANIDKDKMDEAKGYIVKILDANANYFVANQPRALALADVFAQKGIHDVAARIYEILVANANKRSELYEVALKNLGIQLANDRQTQRAYEYLKRYETEFKDGDYLAEVQTAMDRLFFELGESNSTKLHEYYGALMEKYENSEIGQKALASKVELSFNERKFREALQYIQRAKDQNLTSAINFINLSALELAKQAVRDNDCQEVINLLEYYDINTLELPQFKLHDCFVRTARYERALGLATSRVQDENLEDRVEWLVRVSADNFMLKNYEASIAAANDALSLGTSVPYADPSPVLFDRFYSLLKLDRFAEAIRTLGAIEELRGQDFKRIETYDALAKYAFSRNDYANASIYARKALALANSVRISTFSPDLNFLSATASLKLDELDEALDEAKFLLNMRLNQTLRSRALSLAADIYIAKKQPNEARKYLDECVKSNAQNEYRSLCEASLKMLK